jgi:hypothetical protein
MNHVKQVVGSLGGLLASARGTLSQTYAHLASIARSAGVCDAGGNRLIALHGSKSQRTLIITDSLGAKASRLEPVEIGDCSGSASARRLYLLPVPADGSSTPKTDGRQTDTPAASPALSSPCDADPSCLAGYAEGEGDDVVSFVGSPTNDAECLEDGLLDPQQPVKTDIVGGELCQIVYQAAALNYLYVTDIAGSEARCLNSQVDNPNSGASDPLDLGICGTAGAAAGFVGDVQTDLYQTEAEAQCVAGQTTNPNPGAPDPIGIGACGDVGTAVATAGSTAGSAVGAVTSAAGESGAEFQCLENQALYPNPDTPDPLGTGLCGDVGTAISDGESGAATVVSAAESGVGQLAGALAAAAGQVGLEFQCLQNALQYPTPGVPDPLGTGICGDVGTAVFDTESAVDAALSAAGQIPGVVASAAGQVGLEFQCLQNALQYPTPGVPDPLGTGICGDVGTAVFNGEAGVGSVVSAAGQIPGVLASAAGELGLEFQCLQNAVQYPTPGVPDPLGTGICGDVGTAVFDGESGAGAAVSTAESAASQIAGALASASGDLGLEFQCLQNAVEYPTPGVPDPLGTGICGDVGTAVSHTESAAGEALSVAREIPGILAAAPGELGLEFQCLENAVQYPTPGVPDPLGTGLCGDAGAVANAGAAEGQCVEGQLSSPNPGTPDPVGTGVCGDVGSAITTAEGAAASAPGVAGVAVAEGQCVAGQATYPDEPPTDPAGTGVCGDVGGAQSTVVGAAVQGVNSSENTVVTTAEPYDDTVQTTLSPTTAPVQDAGQDAVASVGGTASPVLDTGYGALAPVYGQSGSNPSNPSTDVLNQTDAETASSSTSAIGDATFNYSVYVSPGDVGTYNRNSIEYQWGYREAVHDLATHRSSFITLDFGPQRPGTSNWLPNTHTLISQNDIVSFVNWFEAGYWNGEDKENHEYGMFLNVGTNQSSTVGGYSYGQVWAGTVHQILASGQYPNIIINGADDIESSYGPNTADFSAENDWVNGFNSVSTRGMVDYGDAAGCTAGSTGYIKNDPNFSCGDGYTLLDYYNLNYGNQGSFGQPEVYYFNCPGYGGEQPIEWANVSEAVASRPASYWQSLNSTGAPNACLTNATSYNDLVKADAHLGNNNQPGFYGDIETKLPSSF